MRLIKFLFKTALTLALIGALILGGLMMWIAWQ